MLKCTLHRIRSNGHSRSDPTDFQTIRYPGLECDKPTPCLPDDKTGARRDGVAIVSLALKPKRGNSLRSRAHGFATPVRSPRSDALSAHPLPTH